MIDFKTVATQALASAESLCRDLLPGGKMTGREYVCGSPDGGKGRSFSVNIQTGKWADFAGTEKGGDMISLVAIVRQCNQVDAAKWLSDRLHILPRSDPKKQAKQTVDEWVRVPTPANPPPLPSRVSGKPRTGAWEYHHEDGSNAGWAVRGQDESGKAVLPVTWCRNSATGVECWRFAAMPEPRPLYRLPLNNLPVLVVEGEKTADAAQKILPQYQVTTWAGGCKALNKTDLTPLQGRDVTYWPDADAPGLAAADDFAARVPYSRIVSLPDGLPEGWDLADPIPDWIYPMAMIEAAQAIGTLEEHTNPDIGEPFAPTPPPFRCLGFSGDSFFFLPVAFGQVKSFTSTELTEANLITLARPDWWLANYPSVDKDGEPTGRVAWNKARVALVWQCQESGIFNAENVRGRGCWLEREDVVIHTGSNLVRDGETLPLTSSTWVYERALPLEDELDCTALNSADSAKLIALSKHLGWVDPISALFLVGFIYTAPICGVLSWRPHVWINGPRGVGKSYILNNLAATCMGSHALNMVGTTTEAGVRQAIGRDARPVIMDEMEARNPQDHERIDRVITFARACSSDSTARLYKGTADQKGISFVARASFLFGSIGVPQLEAADASRIACLELKRNPSERFAIARAIASETVLDPLWCAQLRMRARGNAAVIASNARVFAAVLAQKMGDQRNGDQLGALVAGAYGLTSTSKITKEAAAEWVSKQDWSKGQSQTDEADEARCLAHLMESLIPVETSPIVHRPVWEVIKGAKDTVSLAYATLCQDSLARVGLRADSDTLAVACSHKWLASTFKTTAWAGKWGDMLARLPDAEKKNIRISGRQTKCVIISGSNAND
jgi:putative DNA primase/helicase